MKTFEKPILLALAAVIASLCASCSDMSENRRESGNPAQLNSRGNTMGAVNE